MRDEGTDISNIEQLSFCVIDNNFIDFIGFYEIVNLKNETVVTDNVKQLTRLAASWESILKHQLKLAKNN